MYKYIYASNNKYNIYGGLQIEMAGRSRSVGDLDRIGMDRASIGIAWIAINYFSDL